MPVIPFDPAVLDILIKAEIYDRHWHDGCHVGRI